MRRACAPFDRILLLFFFIGSYLSFIGCNDASRTTGSMVEVSAEDKAYLKSKRESYKGGPPKNRAKAASKKN